MANNDTFRRQNCRVMDLELDPENPRIRLRSHEDERARINSLSMPDGKHLRALCEDIANAGLQLDPIVIEEKGERRVVRDGNRRIACLKMLLAPEIAPESIRRRVTRIAENADFSPDEVECYISSDSTVVRDYMRRKHTGEGNGEGLRAWDAIERAFWEADYGFPTQHKRSVQLLRYVESLGIYQASPDFPITTLTRILTDEALQQLGVEGFGEDAPRMSQSEATVRARLKKIVDDLREKRVVVSENAGQGQTSVYTEAGRRAYWDSVLAIEIESEAGTAGQSSFGDEESSPSAGDSGQAGSTGNVPVDGREGGAPTPSVGHGGRPQKPSWDRQYVAAPQKVNGVQNLPKEARKARDLISELRGVNVARHPNACAVLVRMFVEVSVSHYIERKGVRCRKTDLAERLKKTVDNMVSEGVVNESERSFYKQFAAREQVSITTLNSLAHSDHFVGDRQIITSFWDNILPILRNCWHT